MAEPPFLLTNSSSGPNQFLRLRGCARELAGSGQIRNAIAAFRQSLSYADDLENPSHAEDFTELLTIARESSERAVRSIQQDLLVLCKRAMRMNPKKARDTRLITAAVDDLMGDVSVVSERVFDLGISQQLAADMEGYGINDSILEWIEERFSDGTAQNTNEDTGGP